MRERLLEQDERLMGLLCHLLSFAGYVFPMGNVIGPLIIWLLKKDSSEFVDYHGRESVNFQLSMLIWIIIAVMLCFVIVGFVLLPILALVDLICPIIAAVKANDGQYYRYPLTIRFF